MSRSLVLFLTVIIGYQRYGHSKSTFFEKNGNVLLCHIVPVFFFLPKLWQKPCTVASLHWKKEKIMGSIWFQIATFVRTNFNLVKQCVVFSIMPSVQTLWDEEPAIPCSNSLRALLSGNFSKKVTQNLSLNHYSQSYGDLLQPEETMCRVQHSAGFLTPCEILTCETQKALGFVPR